MKRKPKRIRVRTVMKSNPICHPWGFTIYSIGKRRLVAKYTQMTYEVSPRVQRVRRIRNAWGPPPASGAGLGGLVGALGASVLEGLVWRR